MLIRGPTLWRQEYYNVCIEYSMCDVIFGVTTCYLWSSDTGKIGVYDKIVIENQKKMRKYGNKTNFLHKSPYKRRFKNRIHSFIRRADARGSADVTYIAILRVRHCSCRHKVGHAKNISRQTGNMIVLVWYFNLTNESNLTGRLEYDLIWFNDDSW